MIEQVEKPVSERNGKRAQLKSFLSDLEKLIGDCQTLACSLASFARIFLVGSHCKTWPAPLYLPEQVCPTRSLLSLARSTLAKSYRPCIFALARLMRKNTGREHVQKRYDIRFELNFFNNAVTHCQIFSQKYRRSILILLLCLEREIHCSHQT